MISHSYLGQLSLLSGTGNKYVPSLGAVAVVCSWECNQEGVEPATRQKLWYIHLQAHWPELTDTFGSRHHKNTRWQKGSERYC